MCAMHQGEPLLGNVLTLGKESFWLKVACSSPSMETIHIFFLKKWTGFVVYSFKLH